MKKIIVKITPEGEIEIEAEGFKGKSCVDATQFLEMIFDGKKNRKLKPEYYEVDYSQKNKQEGETWKSGW